MIPLLLGILGALGVDVGMGFLVMAQRMAIRFVLVIAAVAAFLFAYNAAYTIIKVLADTAQTQVLSEVNGTQIGSDVLAWGYCLMPASTAEAFSVLFSAYASMAMLNFYWQVIRMKTTGF